MSDSADNSNGTNGGNRLIIKPKQSRVTIVDRITTVDVMINDILHILKDQIEKQRIKAKAATLNDKEVKTIESLTDALVKLSKEERARLSDDEISNEVSNLSDEELLARIRNKSK
jgi:hypothetical protein